MLTFLYIEVLASISPAYVSRERFLYCQCFDRISRGLGLKCTSVQIDTCSKFLTVIKHCNTKDSFWVQTISTITVTAWLCLVPVLAFSHLPSQIHFPPSFLLRVQEPELLRLGLLGSLVSVGSAGGNMERKKEFLRVVSPFDSSRTGYCGLASSLY